MLNERVTAQVRYALIAQLFVTKGDQCLHMVGSLPELGISEIRHEVRIFVNISTVQPEQGLPPNNVHIFEKRIRNVRNITHISLRRHTYMPGDRVFVKFQEMNLNGTPK